MIIYSWEDAAKRLLNNEVGIIPTDTIYGLSCLANNREKIEYIYDLKERDKDKPFIILISNIEQLNNFGVKINKEVTYHTDKLWPGPISIIFKVDEKLQYLHRGMNSLAFRLPNNFNLMSLLKITGPIVSTSANTSGEKNVESIKEAYEIFKDRLDFYLDMGRITGTSSRLVKIEQDKIVYLR